MPRKNRKARPMVRTVNRGRKKDDVKTFGGVINAFVCERDNISPGRLVAVGEYREGRR